MVRGIGILWGEGCVELGGGWVDGWMDGCMDVLLCIWRWEKRG